MYTDFFVKIGMALLAGGIVGMERQWTGKSAGLRTHSLVSLGACLYVYMAFQMTGGTIDPTRILGQVVVGIGFIGAGVIIQRGKDVQGLTSAATLWCSAALGCFAGLGMFVEAISSAVMMVIITRLYDPIDSWIERKTSAKHKHNN